MTTLSKEKVQVLDRVDPAKENLFLIGFRDNQLYSPVLIPTKLVAFPGQDRDETINGIPQAFAEAMADEPTTTENPDTTQILFRKLQSLVSDERLTHRELEVLNHVANGSANKEIARELYISDQTVKNYMISIMRKLDAKSRTHAMILAIRQGLISL